ncbi:MAG: translation initiation factor IF-3 [Oscillospiraceae bacterium]|nr:translation initiation factor IF-3 [Oscillospiraceae bacterium]
MLINDEIKTDEVRVLGEDNEALGIMKRRQAQDMADAKNLDLVLIAPQGNPPVCRIMDYGKFRFEQSKREKELRKNQKHVELKEVRMSLNIDTNDFNTKVGSAAKFLKAGDKVKVTIRFKGREMTHPKLGEQLMVKFVEACAEHGTSEKPSKFEGRNLNVILAPRRAAAPTISANSSTSAESKELKNQGGNENNGKGSKTQD